MLLLHLKGFVAARHSGALLGLRASDFSDGFGGKTSVATAKV